MPYNTTAIPPRKEVTGQTQLPLSRVKKIVAVDPEIQVCSNNAAFAITLATEMFIQYLAEQAQNMAKLDRKPRRNIQYKDLANAVTYQDNLEFLEDVVPKTTTYKHAREHATVVREAVAAGAAAPGAAGGKAKAATPASAMFLTNGGSSSSKKHKSSATTNGSGVNGSGSRRSTKGGAVSDDEPSAQLEMEMQQAAHAHNDDGDVEMTS